MYKDSSYTDLSAPSPLFSSVHNNITRDSYECNTSSGKGAKATDGKVCTV